MPAVGPMELSPEENSFFEAGEAMEPPPAPQSPTSPGPRRRRRSRRSISHRINRSLRKTNWRKPVMSALLMIAAVYVGYLASISVASHTLPDPSEFGVQK